MGQLIRLTIISVCLASGCIGPAAIKTERIDFSEAIASTGREQLLLNLVRVHHRQPPQFLDVSQIINSSQINASLGATFNLPQTVGMVAGGNTHTGHDYAPMFSVGANDSPAVTYAPLSGSALVNQIAQPFTVDTIAALIDSEWHVLPLLSLVADRISLAPAHDPHLIELLQELWDKRLVSFVATKSIATGGSLDDSLTIYFLADQLKTLSKGQQELYRIKWNTILAAYQNTEVQPQSIGIYPPPHSEDTRPHSLTGEPRRYSIEIRTAPATQPTLLKADQVVPAMRLRSGLGMLAAADDAEYVHFIPAVQFKDVWKSAGSQADYVRTTAVCATDDPSGPASEKNEQKLDIGKEISRGRATVYQSSKGNIHLIGIAHGSQKPKRPYACVSYQGEFYYIDECDKVSQRNFQLISQLLTMQAVNSAAPPPSPTISVGGH